MAKFAFRFLSNFLSNFPSLEEEESGLFEKLGNEENVLESGRKDILGRDILFFLSFRLWIWD